jgi:hypothetical protein
MGPVRASIGAIALISLAACGGGGGGNSPIGSSPPTATTYTIGGTVQGLPSGVSITLTNGTDTVSTPNGSFVFSKAVTAGTSYSVAIGSQPDGYSCTAANATGSVTNLNITSVSVSCVATPAWMSFFSEVSGALSVTMPTGTKSAILALPVDVNNDRRDDLVIHYFGSFWGQSVGNTPCPNAIKIFVSQPNDTFKDETNAYLIGSADLGGCSRKGKIADINGDGKSDIVFAINQEDGRVNLSTNANDANAQLAALVSVSGKYTVKLFGTPSWNHSIGVGYGPDNKLFVTGHGYTQKSYDSFYFQADGSFTKTGLTLPDISPTAFEFLNTNRTKEWTNRVLQANNSTMDYLSVEGFIQPTNAPWQTLPRFPLATNVGSVNAIGYDGGGQGLQPVFRTGGVDITFAGLSESCQIKLSPSAENIVLFKISGAIVPNFTQGMTVKQNDLNGYSTFKGVKISNSQISEVSLTIKDEPTFFINSNFFDCEDINGDGYEDIVEYPYQLSGLPFVYLNDKSSSFSYIGSQKFPAISTNWGNSASSLLHDFTGDGIPDLLIWPANGTNSAQLEYRFYKGKKHLQ